MDTDTVLAWVIWAAFELVRAVPGTLAIWLAYYIGRRHGRYAGYDSGWLAGCVFMFMQCKRSRPNEASVP